jgi:hypothetical protein
LLTPWKNAALALVLASPGLSAQVVGGSLSGTISDATGSRIEGATVVIHNEETGHHRADLRPRRLAPGQRASAQRPQLRPAHHAEPRHRELHQSALRRRWHVELFGRQHVLGLRPPPAGQSLPPQRHRVHRRVADQRHPRRHLRPAPRHRRHPRVQRRLRHLLRRLRQARRRTDLHRHHRRHQPSPRFGLRVRCATASSTRATTSTAPASPSSSATTSAHRSAARSRRTSSSSSATTKASARTSASLSSRSFPTTGPHSATCPTEKGVEHQVVVSPISKQLLNLWPVANGPEVLN